MYRQGDVLVVPTNFKIENYEEILPENNKLVLAHGEATGHTHSISPKNAIFCKVEDKMFLMVIKEAELVHEEHTSITLPVGNYEVIRQREYTPEGVRNVAD